MASEGTQELRSTECLGAAPWPGRRPERRRACQSDGTSWRWQKSAGYADTIDPTTGLPLNYCSSNFLWQAAFKRVAGTVYARLIYPGYVDSGWVVPPVCRYNVAQDATSCATQYSGNIFAFRGDSASGRVYCYAYVP